MKSALIVVDVQQSFLHRPYWEASELQPFLVQLQSLIDRAQTARVPILQVFHVENEDPLNPFSFASGHVKAMVELRIDPADVFYKSVQIAATVARQLVVYTRRAGSDPQLSPWVTFRNHIHPAVHRAQDAVLKDPAAEWSSERLAAVACTSERNLTRLFAEHAACSPLDYVQRIRVALARELLACSSLDIERVAERAGFSSAHQLRRVWRRWETQPPTAHRRDG